MLGWSTLVDDTLTRDDLSKVVARKREGAEGSLLERMRICTQ